MAMQVKAPRNVIRGVARLWGAAMDMVTLRGGRLFDDVRAFATLVGRHPVIRDIIGPVVKNVVIQRDRRPSGASFDPLYQACTV